MRLTRLHRRRESVGVTVVRPDWQSAAALLVDRGSFDNGSAATSARTLTLRHKAGTSHLGAGAAARTGVGLLFPFDLPGGRTLDFTRDYFSLRGRIVISTADGRATGHAPHIIMAEQWAATALTTDAWQYGGVRLAQIAGGIQPAWVVGPAHTTGTTITVAGQGQRIGWQQGGMRLAASPLLTRGGYALIGSGLDPATIGDVQAAAVASNQATWGTAGASRVYFGAWLSTNNVAVAAAFEVSFEDIALVHTDLWAAG